MKIAHLGELEDEVEKRWKIYDSNTQEKKELETSNSAYIQQLKKLQQQREKDYESQIKDINAKHENQVAELKENMNQLHSDLEKTTIRATALKSQTLADAETLKVKEDVEKQLQEAVEKQGKLDGSNQEYQKNLDNATEYVLELEEKVYRANKTSLELLRQLKDSEQENTTLRDHIDDLRSRIAVYIPVKQDNVDKKLAEFINNYPERQKLKILFMRESEGVYQFGTKRVHVKCEGGGIKIRVGGGYLSIDEFLDQYTPTELQKLERKDPIRKFNEKVAVQKTIVDRGVRETSPVSGSFSPKKSTYSVKTMIGI